MHHAHSRSTLAQQQSATGMGPATAGNIECAAASAHMPRRRAWCRAGWLSRMTSPSRGRPLRPGTCSWQETCRRRTFWPGQRRRGT
eukprot:4582881-Pleurochrysis_carterae.AAC.1